MSAPSFTPPTLEFLGTQLPGYRFDEFVAQGGMGAVYRAHQRELDRTVAIKVLPKEFSRNQKFHQAFRSEAKAMAKLRHSNLVQIYGSGSINGLPYIVMEFVGGPSAFRAFHGEVIETPRLVELLVALCDGLGEAHSSGIIHRDIKPENILLDLDGHPKLGDFGLAHEVDDEGTAMGTPEYTAPEVIQNPTQSDQRSDIYSLGVILYEWASGSLPGSADAEIDDSALNAIWRKASNPDPDERYQSSAEMARDLTRLSRVSRGRSNRRRKDSWKPAVTAFLAILLIGSIALFVLLSRRGAENVPSPGNESAMDGLAPMHEAKNRPAEALVGIEDEPVSMELDSVDPVDPTVPDPVVEPPPPEVPGISPAQSLRGLRSALAAGEREQMPESSVLHDGVYYFYVSFPMRWDQAEKFASDYGGYLPLIRGDVDLDWLAEQLAERELDSEVWLGTSRLADGRWQQVDASAWPLEDEPEGDGVALALGTGRAPVARISSVTLPFFIAWRADGRNPIQIEAILHETGRTINSPAPAYPRGTVELDGCHYYVALKRVHRPGAITLALISGGRLATLSTEEKSQLVSKLLGKRPEGESFWVGASRRGLEWHWDSKEPWTHASWDEGAPSGKNSALMVSGSGWKDASPHEVAAGAIIEWCDEPPPPAPLTASEDDLEERARDLITPIKRDYSKALKANADALVWHLDAWLSGHKKSYTQRWTPRVAALKRKIKGSRVPTDIPKAPNNDFTEKMIRIAADSAERQAAIDVNFTGKAERVRDAYAKLLEAELDSYQARGQLEMMVPVRDRIEAAGDLRGWISELTRD